MSLMLTKRSIEALVGTALVVAILLAVFPAVAEAQSTAKGGAAAAAERSVVVVEPGDSLWSISAQRLGPGASAQQIAKGTERIYALNRDQIGADPNLLIVGQRLSLPQATMDGGAASDPDGAKATSTPPSATREAAGRAAAAATPARGGQESNAGATAVRGETSQASRTIEVGQVAATEGGSKASEDAARPVSAERQAGSEDSPLASLRGSVRSVVSSATSAVGETFAEVRAAAPSEPRTTLGWAIVVLTVVVGALMAWKLPMRRTTRRDAEEWGMPAGYFGYGDIRSTSYSGERPPHESPAGGAPVAFEPTPNRTEANDSSTEESPNGTLQNGTLQAARRRRRALRQRALLQRRRHARRRHARRRVGERR